MSQRKAAAAKVAPVKAAPVKRAAAKPAVKVVAPAASEDTASADAVRLATEIERGVKDGKLDTLSPEAFQKLMAALCRSYGTQREAGVDYLPIAGRNVVSPTEIMTIASGLLRAADLAVFELGMWQSWTGR
jgi:hypothetical protein